MSNVPGINGGLITRLALLGLFQSFVLSKRVKPTMKLRNCMSERCCISSSFKAKCKFIRIGLDDLALRAIEHIVLRWCKIATVYDHTTFGKSNYNTINDNMVMAIIRTNVFLVLFFMLIFSLFT